MRGPREVQSGFHVSVAHIRNVNRVDATTFLTFRMAGDSADPGFVGNSNGVRLEKSRLLYECRLMTSRKSFRGTAAQALNQRPRILPMTPHLYSPTSTSQASPTREA